MGMSNLTSSIRARNSVSITNLKKLSASSLEINGLELISNGDVLTLQDTNRNKILSTNRSILNYSINHKNVKAIRWLSHNSIPSNIGGYRFIRDATITGMTIQVQVAGSGVFTVVERTDIAATTLTTVTLASELSKTDKTLNVDINEGSVLEVKLISGEFSYPTFSVEFAWRF